MNAIDSHTDEYRYLRFCQLLDIPGNPTPANWAAWIAKLDANKVVARGTEDSPHRTARLQREDALDEEVERRAYCHCGY